MAPVTTVEEVRRLVGTQGGGTSAGHGAHIYDFVRSHRMESCLELGFAWGVGAAYISAALNANGAGQLTSVDMPYERGRATDGQAMLERGGLADRVTVVLEEGGYNWFLHRKLREQVVEGTLQPLYDFIFLDGAHTWLEDGFALLMCERLLKPGGWIHLDDLDWLPTEVQHVPESQRHFSHVQDIWDLLVVPDPAFDEMHCDGSTAWARKSLHPVANTRVIYKQDLLASARSFAREVRSRVRSASG